MTEEKKASLVGQSRSSSLPDFCRAFPSGCGLFDVSVGEGSVVFPTSDELQQMTQLQERAAMLSLEQWMGEIYKVAGWYYPIQLPAGLPAYWLFLGTSAGEKDGAGDGNRTHVFSLGS